MRENPQPEIMDSLDRLYRRLVDALRREQSDSLDRPLTISEIYQNLVPYRAVRTELGFGELAEYEHTLLRLLAGERGYVTVDLPRVRDDFERELRSPNPILGLYRDYAAVGARLRTDATMPGPSGDARPGAPEPASSEPATPAADPMESPVPPPSRPSSRPGSPRLSSAPARPASAGAAPRRPPARALCRACGKPLPDIGGLTVRFCPFCGVSQQAVPCEECSTPIEPEWRFCIQCGVHRRIPAASASAS